jgi:hypothetical protein
MSRKYYLNTIDMDNTAYYQLLPVLDWIVKCPFSAYVAYRDSCRGDGYHIKIICTKNCLYCRDKFDDWRRFLWDLLHESRKEPEKKNVLWKTKKETKNGKIIEHTAGEWIFVKP